MINLSPSPSHVWPLLCKNVCSTVTVGQKAQLPWRRRVSLSHTQVPSSEKDRLLYSCDVQVFRLSPGDWIHLVWILLLSVCIIVADRCTSFLLLDKDCLLMDLNLHRCFSTFFPKRLHFNFSSYLYPQLHQPLKGQE